MARLQAGHLRVQIPAGTRNSSLLQNIQTGSGSHTASYSMGTKDSCHGDKAAKA